MDTFLLIAIILLSIILGYLIGKAVKAAMIASRNSGTLVIDRSDPNDVPYAFLELNEPIDILSQQPFVVLKVENKNYITQK